MTRTKIHPELEDALHHLASAMYYGEVGSEWEDCCDAAEAVAHRFRFQYYPAHAPMRDRDIAPFLYAEAARYQDM